MSEQVVGYPPNIDEIDATFHVRDLTGVIFTYGDKIYIPDGGGISDHILAHENVHVGRQLAMGADLWWRRYIEDVEFRLAEELPAHKAEYQSLCAGTKDRNLCARHLYHVASKLAAPLYGSIITPSQARKVIAS